jgi:thiamine-monophosphate kinase
MDVSDGLAGDLAKMMRASGVSAAIDADRVPLSPAARKILTMKQTLIDTVLTGGDDYEILCTIPEARFRRAVAAAAEVGLPLTAIGQVVAGTGLPVFRQEGTERRYAAGSFSHF